MYQSRFMARIVSLLLAAALLWLPAEAKEVEVHPSEQFCFSAEDFTMAAEESGIFITKVPLQTVASVYWGNRMLKEGDAVPKSALDQLTLVATGTAEGETAVGYYTVGGETISNVKELQLRLKPKKNNPPVAEAAMLETYKNISNAGMLQASDPDGDILTFAIIQPPKRGEVELTEDGSFTYTPDRNKVGKDSFLFTASDPAGNVSEPAAVQITIKKPGDKAVYSDMSGDPDAFEAMWLRDQGLFSGATIGGNLCFSPELPVSRGEFLVMVMKMVEAEASTDYATSGFADEPETPVWMQPYIVSALSNGMITGVSSERGVVFRPSASMTKAETAVMLQNILHLPTVESTTVFAASQETTVPAWAMDAAAALSQAGFRMEMDGEADVLTRRDAAKVLYQVGRILDQQEQPEFFWQK